MMPLRPEQTWFTEARFGLFVHWGLYAIPARASSGNGLSEWIMHNERLTDDQYAEYFERFDPDLYDPRAWAKAAKAAGMKYTVLTTKHSDGFCLWDSKLTEFKATNTPAARDLVAEFVEAFRSEGLRVGFYHSLIDWHHPDFPLDGLHPQRDDLAFREANQHRDGNRYAEYLHGQVRELLTNYGAIDSVWFDFSYPQHDWGWSKGKGIEDWRSEELLALVRELQPQAVVNNRLGLDGDFVTPEETQPLEWPTQNGERVPWEACQTLNGSWGYARDNRDWKSPELIVRTLVDAVSKGGNLLLNVGPNARGELQAEVLERLEGLATWNRLHAASIHGCSAADLIAPPDCRYTRCGSRLYLHLFAWPLSQVHLPDLAGRVAFARFLHDGSEVRLRELTASLHDHLVSPVPPGTLTLELPARRPDVIVPVIELELKGDG
jgi:alpha-L-fucosidase